MIGNERDEVTSAYQAEIDALEASKGKASTSAAQRIQLDQKIADARANMVKAQKEADSELKVLAANEEGRVKKQTASLKTYTDALDLQTEALRRSGRRAVLGVGRGDRENALSGELNSQDDRFANASRELANQRSAAALQGASQADLDKEFGPRVAALAKQNQEATEQIRQNYADLETAQGDWTNGARSAFQNYLDSAKDVAGQTKSLFTNAFSSMEDSIVNFAITGKGSFGDFTKSVLADMARIATRQAASGLLSSIAGSALGAWFGGGGASSAGSTQAGYSGDLSGFTPGSIQAKGGAWSGGVQMFANGAAFANSIVSKPTAFGMAGGGIGVMGEAGEEAIMPLTRTAGGQLGVRALTGGGSGTAISINAPVTVVTQDRSSEGMQIDQQALSKSLQSQMQVVAEKAVADSWRAGGTSFRNVNGRA